MSELPTGTVTFLFTDIEGSTRLLHELGDAYADAFFVAFARAKDAVAAAAEGQRALDGGPICVRIGLHTGEPLVTDEGYVGLDVHRAARIAGVAHGGQIVLSERTRVV